MVVGAMPRPTAGSLSIVGSESVSQVAALRAASVRIPALDGLRGVAILLVLLWHGVFQIQTDSKVGTRLLSLGSLSWSGVDLFFVLSGFLIGGILLDAQYSSHYFRTFYLRRAYRILPLYGVLLFVQIVSHLSFLPRWIAQSAADPVPFWSYVTFTQNIWMGGIASFGSLVMSATWSLAIEEQFYLTSPILIRHLKKPDLTKILVVVVLSAPALRIFLFHAFSHGGFASYVLMPCRADDLCLGILVAMVMRDPALWIWVGASRHHLYWIAGVLALPLIYCSWQHYGPYSRVMVTAGYSSLGLFYTCCLLITLTAEGKIRGFLCGRWLTQLGTLAYCTYLFHLPVIEFCARLLRKTAPRTGSAIDLPAGLLGITLTLVFAMFSWKYFERPLLRRGHTYKY